MDDGFSRVVALLLFEDVVLTDPIFEASNFTKVRFLTESTLRRGTWCHIFVSHAVKSTVVEQSETDQSFPANEKNAFDGFTHFHGFKSFRLLACRTAYFEPFC